MLHEEEMKMKLLIVGVNGRVGSLVAKQAKQRGIEVTGLGENANTFQLEHYLKMNALNLTKEDLVSYDVVVDAVGGWTKDTIPNITKVMIHLADLLNGTKTRLVVVGGAGSLFVNKERTITVDMGKDFPDSWKPLSDAHGAGLKYLRKTDNLNWTYISPACNFVFDGKQEGEYVLGGENLILNSHGESMISYADYAIALVDEVINNKHNKERISVVSK